MMHIDPESRKPLQCSACGSQNIANMLNQEVIKCLSCGKEKPDPNSISAILKREMGSKNNTWTPKVNDKPYRDF